MHENNTIFPFRIVDHPQMEHSTNIAVITSAIIVTSLTYFLGYMFLVGYFKGLLNYTLSISESFQIRFYDLEKYDTYSGYYYASGVIIYLIAAVFLFIYSIIHYSKLKTVDISRSSNKNMIFGTAVYYIVPIFCTYFLIFMEIGISDERYVGTTAFFTAFYFPLLLGLSIAPFQWCGLSTAAFFHRLNKA